MIVNLAQKIQKRIMKNNLAFFTMDIKEQKKILKGFEEPKDLIERSYYQFLCQKKQTPFLLKAVQFIASIFLTPYYYINYSKKLLNNYVDVKKKAIFITGINDPTYIPLTLQREYDKVIWTGYTGSNYLGVNEKDLVAQIYKRYWYEPYFCLKCMLKIALYSYQVNIHNPSSIITFGEFSFTSSVLTLYCNKVGIEHINVMHGEKLFNIRDSFVEFDRYYVWDQHYAELLIELRASKEQFIVEIPESVKLIRDNNIKYKYDYTYYLGGESKEELYKIKGALERLKTPCDRICIRYHPRYCDEKQINEIFIGFAIENPNNVALNDSVFQSRNIISLYSTVLYQAYESGKSIIIDDVSNPPKYKMLKYLRYIMLSKPHYLLSEMIGDNKK